MDSQKGPSSSLKSSLKQKSAPLPRTKQKHKPNTKTFIIVNKGQTTPSNHKLQPQKRRVRFKEEPEVFILQPPTPEQLLECHDCAFGFDTLESFEAHFREVHPEPQQADPVPTAAGAEAPKPEVKKTNGSGKELKCYIQDCELTFKTIPTAKAHLLEVHGEQPQNLVSCPTCGQLERNTRELHQHQTSVHVKLVTCNICGRRFQTLKGKKAHLRASHGLEDDNGKCVEHGEAVFLRRVFQAHFKSREVTTGKQLLLT